MPKADCELCGGTGWVVRRRDDVSSADRCTCVAETASAEVYRRARIPENFRTASFETFHLPQDNPTAQRALADVMLAVAAFTRNFPNAEKPGLLLVGPPGTGKTHLAVAAMRELLAKGHECMFFDYQNLLDQIRAGYSEALGTSSREAYRVALEADVLLLDDLGAHRVTDWVEDTVTAIVNHRYSQRKALIATTNLTDPEIDRSAAQPQSYKLTLEQRVGERARSRLFEMCRVIRMPSVEDYRVKRLRT